MFGRLNIRGLGEAKLAVAAVSMLAALLATGGAANAEEETVRVYAHRPWNNAKIDVKPGDRLEFQVKGWWVDFFIPCGADGYAAQWFYRLGLPPKVNDDARYFRLMGRIADRGSSLASGTQINPEDPNASFIIGQGASYIAERSGRLYLFANDRKGFYWNNWGWLDVHITHTAAPSHAER